ncbi:hypothetical protein [Robiginitalea sediminis]|uniref:hypothetical protein n=1 Tax=Robiginitalea sediminis TaxID=1982593 RepID=UPI000B4AD6DC|nr:hypothetical protein [Robiginitalea sediminis]
MKAKKEHSGFTLPEGYFDGFANRLEKRLQEGPGLVLPEKEGFAVPEGYFEAFPDRLSRRLSAPKGKVRSLWSYTSWVAAAAAAIALTLVFWPAQQTEAPSFEDLAGMEIEQYLESGYDDLSAYELAESLPLEHIAVGTLLESVPGEEHILDYLDQNMEDDDAYYWNED